MHHVALVADFCRGAGRASALPRGLFESNHDIGLGEDKRGGRRGGGSSPTCDPSGPTAYFTLIVKVVGKGRVYRDAIIILCLNDNERI
jgi:hypothetical protein